jgi:ribosome-associated protein
MAKIKLLTLVEKALSDKLAEDVQVLAVSKLTPFADYNVFSSASNTRKIDAIVSEIKRVVTLSKTYKVHHIEGRAESGWVLIDCYDVIVHVMSEEQRQRMQLEALLGERLKKQAKAK